MDKNTQKPEERIYPDPRYVYQPVLVLGSSGKAEIQMVVVECTKTQAKEGKPAEAVVDTMDAVLDIDPFITAVPTDKLYQLHNFDCMITYDDHCKNRHFMSIVGKSVFSEIEKYDEVPKEVARFWYHDVFVRERIQEGPKGCRFVRK